MLGLLNLSQQKLIVGNGKGFLEAKAIIIKSVAHLEGPSHSQKVASTFKTAVPSYLGDFLDAEHDQSPKQIVAHLEGPSKEKDCTPPNVLPNPHVGARYYRG